MNAGLGHHRIELWQELHARAENQRMAYKLATATRGVERVVAEVYTWHRSSSSDACVCQSAQHEHIYDALRLLRAR